LRHGGDFQRSMSTARRSLAPAQRARTPDRTLRISGCTAVQAWSCLKSPLHGGRCYRRRSIPSALKTANQGWGFQPVNKIEGSGSERGDKLGRAAQRSGEATSLLSSPIVSIRNVL